MEQKPILGIVGGSGLYAIDGLKNQKTEHITTPFGEPSGPYLVGELHGATLVFLPRHGPGHVLSPSEINYRANIHGFRQLGVRQLISVSAVGSLRQDIHPGDMVLPDQFFDRTKGRHASFFGHGAVAHVSFGDPVCPVLHAALHSVLDEAGVSCHVGGTYVCMEGPVFSTRAESLFYKSIGASVIGMTALPEAKLAREAQMCYATLALSTDYDCWHQSEQNVKVDTVLEVLAHNIGTARAAISSMAARMPLAGDCQCRHALDVALLTSPDRIPPETRSKLNLLAGHLFKA